jgi:hypothetical protein
VERKVGDPKHVPELHAEQCEAVDNFQLHFQLPSGVLRTMRLKSYRPACSRAFQPDGLSDSRWELEELPFGKAQGSPEQGRRVGGWELSLVHSMNSYTPRSSICRNPSRW